MAHIADTRAQSSGLFEGLRRAAASLNDARRARAEYRRVYDELAALSDRDLADLGIHRSDVAGVARAASRA